MVVTRSGVDSTTPRRPAPPSGRRRSVSGRAAKQHEQPHFEFFGPYLGPIGIILGLPAVCYALVWACNAGGCLALTPQLSLPGFPPGQRFFRFVP